MDGEGFAVILVQLILTVVSTVVRVIQAWWLLIAAAIALIVIATIVHRIRTARRND